MTKRKDALLPEDRVTEFVDREAGAAEARISPTTWDDYVKEGRIPPACPGFPPGTLRWYWPDVRDALRGDKKSAAVPIDRAAAAGAVARGPEAKSHVRRVA